MGNKCSEKWNSKIMPCVRQNGYSYLLMFLVVVVGTFMGFHCARNLPVIEDEKHIVDTIYIEHFVIIDTVRVETTSPFIETLKHHK